MCISLQGVRRKKETPPHRVMYQMFSATSSTGWFADGAKVAIDGHFPLHVEAQQELFSMSVVWGQFFTPEKVEEDGVVEKVGYDWRRSSSQLAPCRQCEMQFKGKTDQACLLRMKVSCHHWAKLLLHLYSMLCLVPCVTSQSDTMTPNSTINSNNGMILLSKSGVFQVGFVSGMQPNLPSPMYTFAIWYANLADTKVVWVANRSMALSSSNASLSLSALGDLQVHGNSAGSPKPVWRSNTESVSHTSYPSVYFVQEWFA